VRALPQSDPPADSPHGGPVLPVTDQVVHDDPHLIAGQIIDAATLSGDDRVVVLGVDTNLLHL
jgi:hypothetical protein